MAHVKRCVSRAYTLTHTCGSRVHADVARNRTGETDESGRTDWRYVCIGIAFKAKTRNRNYVNVRGAHVICARRSCAASVIVANELHCLPCADDSQLALRSFSSRCAFHAFGFMILRILCQSYRNLFGYDRGLANVRQIKNRRR